MIGKIKTPEWLEYKEEKSIYVSKAWFTKDKPKFDLLTQKIHDMTLIVKAACNDTKSKHGNIHIY